ncbi:MAG: DUF459 domain-containing protein [Pseudolabrys sp.]|jgi:hypothetical protein
MVARLTHFAAGARAGILILLVLLLTAGAFTTAQARTSLSARSHHVTVAVLGDSVAHDLARGMEALFKHDRGVRVIRQTKFATGLVRTDYYNWDAVASAFMRLHNPDIVVTVVGGNDKQDIRVHRRRYDPLSKGWIKQYERRVSRFMRVFQRDRHAKVYWVGLPPVRSQSLDRAYREFNRIFKREARRHHFHYIDVWKKFTTRNGAYTSFGHTLNGVRRQLRMNDGQHFTPEGRLVFADYVARQIGLR